VIGQFKVQLESGKQLSKRNLNNRLSAARLVQKIAYSPISPVHLNAFLIDRKYFIQMDGLDPSNLKSEDKDLIIRILRDGVPMEICNSFHYIYRKHELPRSELVVKRAEWFLYRQKMIQKNFSGFTKYSSMVLQRIYDLVKLVYEGLFRYRF